MIRSTVLRELLVWSVPKTSGPVSAAVKAREIVSKSRITDEHDVGILAQGGLQARRKVTECSGTSRWVMMLRLLR